MASDVSTVPNPLSLYIMQVHNNIAIQRLRVGWPLKRHDGFFCLFFLPHDFTLT
jgi:hypothetical protein